MSLLQQLLQNASRNGLNLVGLVDSGRFDRCQPREQRVSALRPKCGTVVVLGTGGRHFWPEFARQGGQLPENVDGDAADELAAASVAGVADQLQSLGVACHVVDSRRPLLNFGRLAEAAGFGIVSPVSGMLLHPEFGPWLRVRAALLVDGLPFGAVEDASITDRFHPCCSCDKPCVTACPPAVHSAAGHSDRRQCAEHRYAGGCATGCHSRAACPIGGEHGDGDGPTLHAHSIGNRTLQRWFGLGLWRLVPRFLRGGPRL